ERANHRVPCRASRLAVEDRLPGSAGIGRLPDTAVAYPYIKRIRLARMSCRRPGAAGRVRPNVSPAHLGEQARVELVLHALERRACVGCACGDECQGTDHE